jgi:hypothetical protein
MLPYKSRQHEEVEPCDSGWPQRGRGGEPRDVWETSGAEQSADRQEWTSALSLDLIIGRRCGATHTAAGS